MRDLHTLPEPAQQSIIESLSPQEQQRYGVRPHRLVGARQHPDHNQAQHRPAGPVPNQHAGQLPAEQIANMPGSAWHDPRDPRQGGT